jgi:sulfate adenylyltransferase
VPAEVAPSDAIAPHGGKLINRFPEDNVRAELRARASELPSLTLDIRAMCDLELIAVGALSPLEGYMGRADYQSVIERGRLADGLPWTVPITLSTNRDQAGSLKEGGLAALRATDGRLLAVIEVRERYAAEKQKEAQSVYRTTDEKHPGVAYVYKEMGDVLVAGPIQFLDRVPPPFPAHHLDPKDTRALFRSKGWKSIVAFQTRNPIHRAHEYLTKVALEICDGLLLHPLVGYTKDDDIPAHVRMECYEVLMQDYYPRDRVLLSCLPAAMRYAGPKEAILHAIMRKNYGCTHFIVGRDHAGVGNYYGTYDAQKIFDDYSAEEIGIQPLMFEHSFYCKRCVGMATTKTCPHDKDARVILSGTAVRDLLRKGETPPPEFSRPEVAQILIGAMKAS